MYNNIPQELLSDLNNAPKVPGVYIFRDESEVVLYVGKAVNLYNRSRSYFANYRRLDPRLKNMVELAASVEYLTVTNEVEALLLESNVIKKYLPKYNIALTDDKSYIWVKVVSEIDFPIVSIVYSKKNDNADYFGPFPGRGPIRRMLRQLRKTFPYRSCNRIIEEREGDTPTKKFIYSNDQKPCLYYHIGMCSAPCTTKVEKSEYRSQVNSLKRFFRSEHADIKKDMLDGIKSLSAEQKYEKAAELRDQLRDLEYLTKFSLITEDVDDEIFKQKTLSFKLEGLKQLIERLQLTYPTDEESLKNFRIECYDISNIQGTNAVASMVVSKGGTPFKKDYRKFKIKQKETPDDFAMLQEALDRRLKYLTDEYKSENNKEKNSSFTEYPNLIVIDGGKGQLSSVYEILKKWNSSLSANIPVIGLAKREEEVFAPIDNSGKLGFKLVRFGQRTPALRILQGVRDEAHRFGLGYHRLLRSKQMTYSKLDLIPGVGEVTKKNLLLAFGSVEGIKKAKLEDLEAIVRNRSTALKIKKILV